MTLSGAVSAVVNGGNCTGCGACALAFAGVEMVTDSRGYERPQITSSAQPGDDAAARRFREICPGVGQRYRGAPETLRHPIAGPYIRAWRAHATDAEVRYAGSSGGVLTALNSWLLESGKVRSVSTAGASRSRPSATVPVKLTTRAEAMAAAGSRYAPVSTVAAADLDASCAFIGKPCEASAVRALVAAGEGEAPIVMSFFCAGTPSQFATDRLARELLPEGATLAELRYRGHGWPGNFTATSDAGDQGSLSYEESWGRVLGRALQTRCKLCIDGVGGDADIAVGDFWDVDERGYPVFEDADGSSVVLARTPRGVELILEAVDAGVIEVGPIDVDLLAQVQPLQRDRARAITGRLIGRWLAGHKVPRYRGYQLTLRLLRWPVLNIRALAGTWLRSRNGKL